MMIDQAIHTTCLQMYGNVEAIANEDLLKEDSLPLHQMHIIAADSQVLFIRSS